MSKDEIVRGLRVIASKGHTSDEDNQWLFDVADFLAEEWVEWPS